MKQNSVWMRIVLMGFWICALSPAQGAEPDRSPKNIGSVLVFSGTGWYRHPEVPAIAGWLARQSDRAKLQIDVTESPADLIRILDR